MSVKKLAKNLAENRATNLAKKRLKNLAEKIANNLAENPATNLAKKLANKLAKKHAPVDEQLDGKTAYFLKVDTCLTPRFLTRFLPRFFPRFVWSSFGPCFGMRVGSFRTVHLDVG